MATQLTAYDSLLLKYKLAKTCFFKGSKKLFFQIIILPSVDSFLLIIKVNILKTNIKENKAIDNFAEKRILKKPLFLKYIVIANRLNIPIKPFL